MTSQYPAAMKNPMPSGIPVHVHRPKLDGFFGFCHANVIAPDNLAKPFLQYKPDNKSKVITPLGKFSGW